jgi:hypothetical protein
MIEKILDFSDIQKFQERFHIPFTSSISRWTYDVINAFHSEGEECVELWIAIQVLPTSHATTPGQWVTIIRKKIKYPYISGRRTGGYVIITAQNTPIETTRFMPRLVATLQQDKRAEYHIDDLPNAYQKNPYQLIYKLRIQKQMSIEVHKMSNSIVFSIV